MNKLAIDALQRVGLGVLEAVEAGEDTGAPGGILYAAMQAHGASLNQFQSFMDTLTGRGFLTVDQSHCYRMTDAGKAFKAKLQEKFAPRPGN